MPWTERQHRLLRAMGLRLWSPPVDRHDGALAMAEPPPAPAAPGAAGTAQQPVGSTAAAATAPAAAPGPATPPPPAARAASSGPVSAASAPAAPAAAQASAGTRTPQAAMAHLDWPALREAVAGCRACGLCESRTQTVFGVGHPQAHWLVIGEAPGEQEDLSGEPFVGAAGQLLDRMLAALQLTRAIDGPQPPSQRVYIANTLKCRPPRNRNPTAEEMACCEPFLLRQIELLKPRMILAMGRFAVQALLRSQEPVGQLRGRVHRYHGVPLVVTYHPAYLLRNLQHKARAWEDLCLAADAAEAAEAQQATQADPAGTA